MPSILRQNSELCQHVDHGHKTQFKEYLQTFERRHSDSNCILNRSSSCEKVNLADEIKKLSERLMMLSSINNELTDYNEKLVAENQEKNQDSLPITIQEPAVAKVMPKIPTTKIKTDANMGKCMDTMKRTDKPIVKEKPDFLKSKIKEKSEDIKSRFNAMSDSTMKSTKTTRSSTFTRASSVINTSSFHTSSSSSSSSKITLASTNGLSERLRSLDEMPNLGKKVESIRKVSDSINIKRTKGQAAEIISSISPPNHGGSAPWPVTSRRTKFRVTQMSRDVPVGSPNTHQNVFLEEAVNTTKDCLLHLLDKYNETETRTAYGNTGRHQSMSVGFGLSDNVEYRSMNSLNFFFQRHASAGSTVKQMQAQLESKRKQ